MCWGKGGNDMSSTGDERFKASVPCYSGRFSTGTQTLNRDAPDSIRLQPGQLVCQNDYGKFISMICAPWSVLLLLDRSCQQ